MRRTEDDKYRTTWWDGWSVTEQGFGSKHTEDRRLWPGGHIYLFLGSLMQEHPALYSNSKLNVGLGLEGVFNSELMVFEPSHCNWTYVKYVILDGEWVN